MKVLFLSLLFFILPVSAKEGARWHSSGSFQAYYKQYSFNATDEAGNSAGGINGQWKADWKGLNHWRFKSDLDFQTDGISKAPSEKVRGNPRSFYIENKILENKGDLTLRAGYQTIVPEGPDFLNPADVIHSKDWKDPTNTKTLGSAGISLSHEGVDWQWEAFFIPQQTTPKLPGDRSPWWPRGKRIPIESDDTEFQVPGDIKYQITDGEEINKPFSNNYALRIQRKGQAFEGQAVFYEGLSQDPNVLIDSSGTLVALAPKLILTMNSPVKLKPLYYRHQVLAGTFVWPFESWALKGGANQVKPMGDDPRLPGEVTTGVLGVEKNIETSKGMLTLILQHEVQRRQAKNQISFLKSIYENAWTFGFRIPWGEETQFIGGAVYDTVGKSSLCRLGASRRLNDSFSVELDAQLLQGPEETLLGLYDSYDSWRIGLTYHF